VQKLLCLAELPAAAVPAMPQPDGQGANWPLQPSEAAGVPGKEGQDREGLGAEQTLRQGAERCALS